MRLYLDGVRVADNTGPANAGLGGDLRLGHAPGGAFLGGSLDEVRVYARRLTAGEVQSLFSHARIVSLFVLVQIAGKTVIADDTLGNEQPRSVWAMGPFVKRDQPLLSPRGDSRFDCPVRGREVRWEEQNVYNPAAVVRDGKVYLFYRADDKSPDLEWGRTCRIGMAHSDDGIHFTRHPTPVVYPDNDAWKEYEWEGGCEDLHIVEGEDGTYYMNYTTWNGRQDTMSVATSRDLIHWTKHGPAFRQAALGKVPGSRSGVVVSRLEGDRLIAAKLNGKYWMYCTHPCALAWSDNLIDWTPLEQAVWPGGGHEAGAVALLREEGILLMFNATVWPSRGLWTLGQARIDRHDLTSVLKLQDEPFLYPELEWEQRGFIERTTVANTLVPFRGQWLLYYGAADRHIGLATFSPGPDSPFSLASAAEKKGTEGTGVFSGKDPRPLFFRKVARNVALATLGRRFRLTRLVWLSPQTIILGGDEQNAWSIRGRIVLVWSAKTDALSLSRNGPVSGTSGNLAGFP